MPTFNDIVNGDNGSSRTFSDITGIKPSSDVGTLGTYGQTFKQALKGLPAYGASVLEGDQPYSNTNNLDELQQQSRESQAEFVNQPGRDTPAFGGVFGKDVTLGNIREAAPSLTMSGATMAPAAIGGMIGGIPGALIGGALGYYGMHRGAENDFVRQKIENDNAQRAQTGLPSYTPQQTIDEQNRLIATGDPAKTGLIQAGSETAGNLLDLGILAAKQTPYGKAVSALNSLIPKGLLSKALTVGANAAGKAIGISGVELGEEELARRLQNPINERNQLPTQTFSDIAKPTLLSTLPMAGLGGVVGGAQSYQASKKQAATQQQVDAQTQQPVQQISSPTPGPLVRAVVENNIIQAGQNAETTGEAGVGADTGITGTGIPPVNLPDQLSESEQFVNEPGIHNTAGVLPGQLEPAPLNTQNLPPQELSDENANETGQKQEEVKLPENKDVFTPTHVDTVDNESFQKISDNAYLNEQQFKDQQQGKKVIPFSFEAGQIEAIQGKTEKPVEKIEQQKEEEITENKALPSEQPIVSQNLQNKLNIGDVVTRDGIKGTVEDITEHQDFGTRATIKYENGSVGVMPVSEVNKIEAPKLVSQNLQNKQEINKASTDNSESQLNKNKSQQKPARSPGIKDSDDLLSAISKLGGINSTEAKAQGIDPVAFKRLGHGIKRIFNAGPKAQSYDGMAEALRQYGFDTTDANDLVDKVSRAINQNEKIYSPVGYELHTAIKAEEELNDQEAHYAMRIESLYEIAKQHDNDFGTNFLPIILKESDLSVDNINAWEQDLHDDRADRHQKDDENSQAKVSGKANTGISGELESYTESNIAAREQEKKQQDKQHQADELKAKQKEKADKEIDNIFDDMAGLTPKTADVFGMTSPIEKPKESNLTIEDAQRNAAQAPIYEGNVYDIKNASVKPMQESNVSPEAELTHDDIPVLFLINAQIDYTDENGTTHTQSAQKLLDEIRTDKQNYEKFIACMRG